MEIKPYKKEDANQIITDPTDILWAEINETSGPGFTLWSGDKVLGCGGIRIGGIGEVWAAFAPELKDDKRELLTQSRKAINDIAEKAGLWQLIASSIGLSPQQANFLEHLDFNKVECYARVKEK